MLVFRLALVVSALVVSALVVSALVAFAPAAATAGASPPSWAWPVGSRQAVIRPFIAPINPYAAGHRGIDIGSSPGAVVSAPADGTVYFAGIIVDRAVLSIMHADGVITSYEPVDSELAVGSVVHRGDPVGALHAGHCAQACLHFGVRLHGAYVSPLNYLGGIQRSVLLPTRPIVGG